MSDIRAEAIAAARAAAFTIGSDFEGAGRQIVHCVAGGWAGADWDLADVIKVIESAQPQHVRWDTRGTMWPGHDLHVKVYEPTGVRHLDFAVPRPTAPPSAMPPAVAPRGTS